MTDPRVLLRSYLRQRAELGEEELVLDRLSAAELRALLASRPVALAVPAAEPPRGSASPEPRQPSAAGLERVEVRPPAGASAPGRPSSPPAPREPGVYVDAEQIERLPILSQVREIALDCSRCKLAKTRTHVVFGEGREDADVLVVGEAPGQEEDRSGRPFVGRAGRLLDLALQASGFSREDVYICNVLKCRPPQNRNPQPDEVEACRPYLMRQVELVKPRLILAFGNFAAQTLLGTDLSMGKLRRQTNHRFGGIPVVPTYHPSACLRTQAWTRSVWEDLQRARDLLDAS